MGNVGWWNSEVTKVLIRDREAYLLRLQSTNKKV